MGCVQHVQEFAGRPQGEGEHPCVAQRLDSQAARLGDTAVFCQQQLGGPGAGVEDDGGQPPAQCLLCCGDQPGGVLRFVLADQHVHRGRSGLVGGVRLGAGRGLGVHQACPVQQGLVDQFARTPE